MGSLEYEVTWLARLLHSFPHLDLTFREVNSTFDPDDTRYNESLLFWAAIPVLWLLLTLLLFLIYFCYRCCQRDVEKKQKVPCLRWSMAILALCTCAAVGVGFYGNEETQKGSQQLVASSEETDATVTLIRQQVFDLEKTVNLSIQEGLLGLRNTVFQPHPHLGETKRYDLVEMMDSALSHAKNILIDTQTVHKTMSLLNTEMLVQYAKDYGFWRWLGTLILLCWLILLCLLLLLGIGLSSKCTLLMFCAFGIFSLVLCWLAAGFYLAGGVALGDFCVAPDAYFEKKQIPTLEDRVVEYYLKCDARSSPFQDALDRALQDIQQTNTTLSTALDTASRIVQPAHMGIFVSQVRSGLSQSKSIITLLRSYTECTLINEDYVDGVQGVCYMALPGVVFLFLSCSVTGLLLTLLVLLASRAWRHFGKTKGYLEVDEDDPFLPRPDNTSPSYYSFTRGTRGNPRDHMSLPRRSTPPPAYNSNEFYRQYSDMNSSTMDDTNPFRESHA